MSTSPTLQYADSPMMLNANSPTMLEASSPTMLESHSIASLTTRSEVRGFLAKELNDLIGGQAPQALPAELADLATGSDREVIETSRRLDKTFETRSAADAKRPDTAMGRKIRDLFSKALQRMKELPPDPRETLHAKPLATAEVAQPAKKRPTRR